MTTTQTYNLNDIRSLGPCYDPSKYLPESWTGTLSDVLRMGNVPARDRIWFATKVLDPRTNRLFACWCSRRSLSRIDNSDSLSVNAIDVAERYALGEATDEDLETARNAAWNVARNDAWNATSRDARNAARNGASHAAWNATSRAVEYQAQIDYLLRIAEDLSK